MSAESPLADHEDMEPRVELLRQATTMALYISLSLLAVLIAAPTSVESSDSTLAFTVGATAVGLVLAHQLAFRVSTQLVSHGRVGPMGDRLLQAQVAGGLVAAAVAVLPVRMFSANELLAAELALLVFVCVIGYLADKSLAGH